MGIVLKVVNLDKKVNSGEYISLAWSLEVLVVGVRAKRQIDFIKR